jgi:hypothetical protein
VAAVVDTLAYLMELVAQAVVVMGQQPQQTLVLLDQPILAAAVVDAP